MPDLKSQEEVGFYTELLVQFIRDAALESSCSKVEAHSDVIYVRERTSKEGVPFLTVTLPSLGKALDKALSCGESIIYPPGFRVRMYGGYRVPCFLRRYWCLIETHWEILKSGRHEELSEPIRAALIKAVRAIRQVCYLFYKLRMPYAEGLEHSVLEDAIARDQSLPHPDNPPELSKEAQEVVEGAYAVICSVLSSAINVIDDSLTPRHGGGAVATREKPWKKYNFCRFYPNLDRVFPYADWFFLNYSHLADRLEILEGLEVEAHVISRATTVPKDSRGPRVISMEPLEIMFIQQSLWKYLRNVIERHRITQGRVNFTSQDVNRDLCREASLSLKYDTIDLKDASDRVSLWLVEQLFPEQWVRMLLAARSDHCNFNGTVIELRKFAPMGSAVCFPVESLIFYALAVACCKPILCYADMVSNNRVWVYGDDLIVPHGMYEKVRRVFTELHLALNEDKCCVSTIPFRESCGFDAFLGENVAPLRIKHRWRSWLSPQALMAWCEYQNMLARGSGVHAYSYVTEHLQDQPHSIMNVANRECRHKPCLVLRGATWSHVLASNAKLKLRWNSKLQRMEYRMRGTRPVTIYVTQSDGWWFLFDRLTRSFDDESLPISKNQGAYAVPNQLKFGWRWVPLDEVLNTSGSSQ